MKSNSLSDEDSEMLVTELKQSVNGVDILLENLLVWAKMQMEGDVVAKPEFINLSILIPEIIQLYQKAADNKAISLSYNISENTTAYVDKNNLSLILRNLINNAIKFTPLKGAIMVDVVNNNQQLEISVKDNGIGMSKEEMDRLFNIDIPFTKRGTMNEKGSGLGLLFVKEYTERAGGKFTIVSEKEKGSQFFITIDKH